MNQSHNPLRINVGFLINTPVGTYRDIHFELPELAFSDDITVLDLKGIIRISRTPQGILSQGDFSFQVSCECVRCLTVYNQPLHTEFSDLFAFKGKPTAEFGLVLPDNNFIDFSLLIREYLIMEIPIKPICKPDCKGLCPVCGEDLNVTACEHQPKLVTG